MMTKIFYCPVNGWDCPYFKKDNTCALVDEGDDPVMECDDAAAIYDEEDDYFMYRDEDGKEYDRQELLIEGYHFVNDEPVYTLDHAVIKPMKPSFNN